MVVARDVLKKILRRAIHAEGKSAVRNLCRASKEFRSLTRHALRDLAERYIALCLDAGIRWRNASSTLWITTDCWSLTFDQETSQWLLNRSGGRSRYDERRDDHTEECLRIIPVKEIVRRFGEETDKDFHPRIVTTRGATRFVAQWMMTHPSEGMWIDGLKEGICREEDLFQSQKMHLAWPREDRPWMLITWDRVMEGIRWIPFEDE
jgi:hypothetical protein